MKKKLEKIIGRFVCCIMGFMCGTFSAVNMAQRINVTAEGNDKSMSNLFLYDEQTLVTEENFDLSEKGLDAGQRGLLFKSVKTGDEAEGEKIGFKGILSGEFEIDFRVFSEVDYVPRAPECRLTHSAVGWNATLNQTTNCYASDQFNPYMDLKEVGIKFTSNTDSSKWFIVYVHGGYAGHRADMASARVFTSEDREDWPYALKGYGIIGNDGWPSASWEPGDRQGANYTMLEAAFSNTFVQGESASALIKFDPVNMQVYGYNSGWSLVRDLSGNNKLSTSYKDWFGLLDASDFVGGYTIEMEFTDVTSNSTVGNSIVDKADGYNDVSTWAYQTFDAPYDRYANMLLYSIKAGDVEYAMNATDDLDGKTVAWIDEITSATVNSIVDITPHVYNTKIGDKLYDGSVCWTAPDGSTGEVVAKDGKYQFEPTMYGDYIFAYSPMLDNSTSAFLFGVKVKKSYTVTLKDSDGKELKRETVLEGDRYAFETYAEEGKAQIGWWYNGGLYPIGYEILIDEDVQLTICSIVFSVSEKATIRTEKTNNFGHGMLFETSLDTEMFDKLSADGYIFRYSYGYILPTDLIDGRFIPTTEGLSLKLTYQNGKATFGITDLYQSNYKRDFSILSYFVVNYSDDSIGFVCTKYDENINKFNIYELATEALQDTSGFTAEEVDVLRRFAQ